jgi:hypothetical protein
MKKVTPQREAVLPPGLPTPFGHLGGLDGKNHTISPNPTNKTHK